MSSVPPEPPPPPPPPPFLPPQAGAPPTLPWEDRQRLGFFEALVETVRLFVTEPAEAWRRTPEKGSMVDPLLFAVIVSWIGVIFTSLYGLVFTVPWLKYLPPQMQRSFGSSMTGHATMAIGQMILAPIFIVIVLFIGSGILHLCLMLVGGLSNSTAGFDGTFRVAAYSSVASLAGAIPFVGGLVSAIWKLILVVMGIMAIHRTTQGKAIAAVLIPIVVCCGCFALVMTVFFGMIMSAFHR